MGWLSAKMLLKEFLTPLKVHAVNEVFEVDFPSDRIYYIILKTHADRRRLDVGILKVKGSR